MPSPQKSVEQRLGDAIRTRREELGLSQEQLAFECGLHRTYISQLERGMKSPTVRVLFALAKALKTTPEKLVAQISNQISNPKN
ncbi:MAG: XRE family transcriptional regulator [Chloroflexi bacterium]|nr:MAG: XRE family transcriptional regulator [Chloroflexota bacterium]